jgi:DNA-binding NarL/FixJ family response regulator
MQTTPAPAEGPIGILVVEDQTAIRQMLAAFIAAMPGFAVVGEADNPADALELTRQHRPRVVVLDWMLLGGIGLEFLRAVRTELKPNVLVFSGNTTDVAVRDALAAGAKGYIEKTASFAEFTQALQAVANGRSFFGPAISPAVQRIISNPDQVRMTTELSMREIDVLRLVAEGLSSKEIADQLGVSVRTVENHRASITRRTGLRSIAQMTLHAVRLGLIEAPSRPVHKVAAAPFAATASVRA